MAIMPCDILARHRAQKVINRSSNYTAQVIMLNLFESSSYLQQ